MGHQIHTKFGLHINISMMLNAKGIFNCVNGVAMAM